MTNGSSYKSESKGYRKLFMDGSHFMPRSGQRSKLHVSGLFRFYRIEWPAVSLCYNRSFLDRSNSYHPIGKFQIAGVFENLESRMLTCSHNRRQSDPHIPCVCSFKGIFLHKAQDLICDRALLPYSVSARFSSHALVNSKYTIL